MSSRSTSPPGGASASPVSARGAPLWLLSLQGDFDLLDAEADVLGQEPEAAWYLNPSLFWENPGFTFSAQMQVPVESAVSTEDEEPDYRLRAVFEKRFK